MNNRGLAIVGPGRSGKDTAGEFLERLTGIKYAGTTSRIIAEQMADEMDTSIDAIYESRTQHRAKWKEKGDSIREELGSDWMIEKLLSHGPIISGMRGCDEIEYIIQRSRINHIIWIERDVPPDDTLEYDLEFILRTIEESDKTPFVHIVHNKGDIEHFKLRLCVIAGAIPMLNTDDYQEQKEYMINQLCHSLRRKGLNVDNV